MLTVCHNEKQEREKEIRFQRILAPLDFSEHSANALAYAQLLARDYHAQMQLLNVVEEVPHVSPLEMPPFNIATFTEELVKDAEKRLADMAPDDARLPVESVVRVGLAHQEIKRAAETLPADLIVMGVSGRGVLDTAFFGSTTYRTMRSAPCPVLAVR